MLAPGQSSCSPPRSVGELDTPRPGHCTRPGRVLALCSRICGGRGQGSQGHAPPRKFPYLGESTRAPLALLLLLAPLAPVTSLVSMQNSPRAQRRPAPRRTAFPLGWNSRQSQEGLSQLVAQKPRERRKLRAQATAPVMQPLLPGPWRPGVHQREEAGRASAPPSPGQLCWCFRRGAPARRFHVKKGL